MKKQRYPRVQKLSTEEAAIYVSQEEDLLNRPLAYYTRTSNESGWDDIKYYTATRKEAVNFQSEGKYWIYVLSNPSMPGVLKIGYTKNSPQDRALQISRSTGVPTPFKVEFAFKCHEGEFMESEVHAALSDYRVNEDREFFKIDLEHAERVINEIGKRYSLNN